MPTASATDWLILVGSLLGCGLFIAAAWWALFSDRSRGRRRCPRCWFDMSHTAGLRCTECGHLSREESDLRHTRRRPVIGFIAVFACAVAGAHGIESVRATGLGPYLPTPMLVRMLGAGGPAFREVETELLRRIATDGLPPETWWRILRGAADGSPGAPVTSPQWIDRHGSWVIRAWQGLVAAADGPRARAAREQVLALAALHPPQIELEVPPRWPAGRAIPVGVSVRERWRVPLPIRIAVHDAGRDDVEEAPHLASFARIREPIQRRSFTVMLPPRPVGDAPARLEFRASRSAGEGEPWVGDTRTLAAATIQVIEPETAAPVPGTHEPRRDEDGTLAAHIRRVFDRGGIQWEDGSLPVRLTIDRRQTAVPDLHDTAIGIEVELRRNGRLGRTLALWWLGGTMPSRSESWEVPFVDDAVLLPPATDADRWELTIRSREDLALRVPGARYRWEGQFTRPLNVGRRSGIAPSRGWVPVPPERPKTPAEGVESPPGAETTR
ncbi:MAG: hypothetical protein ACYTEV_09170 [Planctomycetota bacterium]|jgi:hypothetical protein